MHRKPKIINLNDDRSTMDKEIPVQLIKKRKTKRQTVIMNE